MRIGVVGGGILGTSVAFHLKNYAAVTLISPRICPPDATTHNTFSWINAFKKPPQSYTDFSRAAMSYWKQLVTYFEVLAVKLICPSENVQSSKILYHRADDPFHWVPLSATLDKPRLHSG